MCVTTQPPPSLYLSALPDARRMCWWFGQQMWALTARFFAHQHRLQVRAHAALLPCTERAPSPDVRHATPQFNAVESRNAGSRPEVSAQDWNRFTVAFF
jgi:hypothetical protein